MPECPVQNACLRLNLRLNWYIKTNCKERITVIQYYITFPSTYHAIRAEKLLNKEGLTFKMVPVPRVISSSCGIALRCSSPEMEKISYLLRENNINFEGIHEIEEKGMSFPGIFTREEEQ